MDGHFCLLTEHGDIERVPIEVFETMFPSMIVVLKEEPNVICQRLIQRDSHNYSLELITEFQEKEIRYAKEVADTLGVPLEECDSTNRDNVIFSVLDSI